MASVIHLDTHAVIWLAAGEIGRMPSFVESLIQQRGCAVSPIVRLELDYLHEIGRLKVSGGDVIDDLRVKIGLGMDAASFEDVVVEAAKLSWTRDPFDRLICATARVATAPLLTKDVTILANEPTAFWEKTPA
jgi:PIN domain nuclease of toxin-antitoxin system